MPEERLRERVIRLMNNKAWLALDVGGANVKAAHEAGDAISIAFELWKRPQDLHEVLKSIIRMLPPFGRVAVTMTAELCDCFATKAEGVRSVLAEVLDSVGDVPLSVWGTDGRFHSLPFVLSNPMIAAAANWLALAEFAARLVPEGSGLLIDIGSTTTDLIALRSGKAVPKGRTDTARLRSGELVYAGVRRTPVCALANELVWNGAPIGLAAELFATTQDIYLILGAIEEDASNTSTADGRPATLANSRDRLARMVCADRDGLTTDEIDALAVALDAVLVARLVSAVKRVLEGLDADTVVVSGSGEFLAHRVAEFVQAPQGKIVSLSETCGSNASTAGCAHALLHLAQEAFA